MGGLLWLLVGGLFYTCGAGIYSMKKLVMCQAFSETTKISAFVRECRDVRAFHSHLLFNGEN